MTEKMIRDAYSKIRVIDHTIPDEVLDFMKYSSIEKLNSHEVLEELKDFAYDNCQIHNNDRLAEIIERLNKVYKP